MQHFSALILCLLFALNATLPAQSIPFQIEVHTHMNSANDLLIEGDMLYAATGGGLILANLASGDIETMTTVDGFIDHAFSAIAAGRDGRLILGTIKGNLAFLNTADGSVRNDANLAGNEIVDIESVADTLWVLSRTIISVYLYNGTLSQYQFKESYQAFGINVRAFNRMALAQGRVWLASDVGLVNAPSDFVRFNLYAASNWNVKTTADGLPADLIRDVAYYSENGNLLIATDLGLAAYDFSTMRQLNSSRYYNIAVAGADYFLASLFTVTQVSNGQASEVYRRVNTPILDIIPTADGQLWVSTDRQGLIGVSDNREIRINGPLDNYIGQIFIDSNGNLWCASGLVKDERRKGLFVMRADGEWQNYVFSGGNSNRYLNFNSTNTIFEDPEQNVWVGAWGGGIMVFDRDFNIYPINPMEQEGTVWRNTATSDDTLALQTPSNFQTAISPVAGDDYYSVVTDIYADVNRQSIWVINFFPTNNLCLLEYPRSSFDPATPASAWKRFTVPFSDNEVYEVAQDVFGDLWFANQRKGVTQMRFDGDAFQSEHYSQADNLKIDDTIAVAADDDGYVWVGTASGLNGILNQQVFDFRENYQPIGLRINDIYVDSRNNKWFATDKGLSILRGSGSPFEPQSWVDVVPLNSSIDPEQLSQRSLSYRVNLPGENIHSVFIDESSSDVYLGTEAGIAIIVNNPFASTAADFTQVKVGPNPFIIDETSEQRINFFQLVEGSEVRILTANGQLVRVLSPQNFDEVQGGLARWDGRNLDGELVSTGVYLYMVTSEDGQKTTGKLMVVNRG